MEQFLNKILFFASIVATCACNPEERSPFNFVHHSVSTDLPENDGNRYGTPAIADFDNDDDMDFSLSVTRKEVYWFEMRPNKTWVKHKVGEIPTGQLGGVAFDVDKDGWQDLVVGGYWYRNTQDPINEEFIRFQYDSAIDKEIHDMVIKDINNDGSEDVVVLGDREGCFWYEIPENPIADMPWDKHLITMSVLDQNADIHGGFFPGGVNDLDGDGDADIILPGRWYRNEGKGLKWTKKFLPYGSSGYWGLSGRSWIVDMDGDGDQDIVMIGCDQLDSRAAWLENDGKEDPGFAVHLLPLTAEGRRGSFHSLWVADFDQDNDWDIFTMDQEDEKILPTEAKFRAYMWENVDGKGDDFKERVIFENNLGGHDVKFADVDGDGDLDAYFKVWWPYHSNAYGGKPHVDFLENLLISK